MDPSEYFAGGDQQNQKRQLQICGPRPSPLSVHKDSHKIIKKPPKHPAPPQNRDQPQQPYVPREPVVIYAVSPKVVHATASEFMNVVQRLTGISSEVFLESGGGGNVSPAARLASTENASPRGGKEPPVVVARDDEIPTAMEEAAEFGGYAPGILSPSPAMLPTASAGIFSQGGMFSPAIPPGWFSPAGLMSPFLTFSPGYTSLVASPTFADVFSSSSHLWDLQ
ncbi:PREDICTED: protein MKS1-like [Camelina sativa]|uniref:Protein MKS1-like n=1 Tax=Camelina sativa TaxID=90675 RepID=A0ABM0YWV3_CAMSA|nr:PREDICTED: protein MKS1-like [Camelina sativa]